MRPLPAVFGQSRVSLFLPVFLFFMAFALSARTARGDDAAKDRASLRASARAELSTQLSAMSEKDRKRLGGLYVAFDPSTSDPLAQVACDDSGGYVVVLSDAMLQLLSHVARAETYDEVDGRRKVEEYGAYLARTQLPGQKLLAPPPGFFIALKARPTYDERFTEGLAFVLARELAHLRSGDLSCPKKAAAGDADDEWTSAERRKAESIARDVYPGRQMDRDDEAIATVLRSGRKGRGALALLRCLTQFELESTIALGRFSPTYLLHHPSSSLRLANTRRAIETHAAARD